MNLSRHRRPVQTFSILVAESSPHVLEILSILIDGQPDLVLAGTSTDGMAAVEQATDLLPDLVLMDSQLSRLDGIEATRKIKQDLSDVCVLLLCRSPDDLAAGMVAGGDAYLPKDFTTTELFKEIRRIRPKEASR